MREAVFIGGLFFEYEIPKDKKFLLFYFRSDIELQFLRYYFCFNNIENFTDHTGYYCQMKWLKILKKRLDMILDYHALCRKNFDIENMALLEMGEIKIGDIEYVMGWKQRISTSD